jgi:hypothetical protein
MYNIYTRTYFDKTDNYYLISELSERRSKHSDPQVQPDHENKSSRHNAFQIVLSPEEVLPDGETTWSVRLEWGM